MTPNWKKKIPLTYLPVLLILDFFVVYKIHRIERRTKRFHKMKIFPEGTQMVTFPQYKRCQSSIIGIF